MDLTRRGRAAVACLLALLAGGWLLATPALLVAGAGLAAWLLGSQLAFVVALRRERDALAVSLDAPNGPPGVEEATTLHLRATGRGGLPLRIATTLPAAARPVNDRDSGTFALELGETAGASWNRPSTGDEATASIAVEWPVAGRFRVGPPRIDARDRQGLFTAEIDAPASVEVVVESHEPGTTHLGEGRDRIAAFGEHTTGRRGAGTEPAELRPYYPGDDLSRIDWHATARLREAYVTESEAETDRRTVLLVDHRGTTGVGSAGATPLHYLRHAGLALVEDARALGDPLGCYAIGDAGVTVEHPPLTTPGQYDTVATSLQELQPTTDEHDARADEHDDVASGRPSAAAATAPAPFPQDGGSGGAGGARTAFAAGVGTTGRTSGDPARATAFAGRLAGEDSSFARRLEPLFADVTSYVHRVAEEPLFAAARTYLGRLQGSVWTVILTDGRRPGELRETVKLARRGNDHVLVVLAPAALFRAGIGDLDDSRREYEAVAAYADDLAAMDRVTVRQLGPGDVAESVLGARGGRA